MQVLLPLFSFCLLRKKLGATLKVTRGNPWSLALSDSLEYLFWIFVKFRYPSHFLENLIGKIGCSSSKYRNFLPKYRLLIGKKFNFFLKKIQNNTLFTDKEFWFCSFTTKLLHTAKCRYQNDFLKYRLFIGSYTNDRINRKYRRSGMPVSWTQGFH